MAHVEPLTNYEQFLLTEYNNIAQAHFNTVNTISTFFRYYLLIVALPVPMVVFFGTSSKDGLALLERLGIGVPLLATVIALVGVSVMGYVTSLRFSAILYARTVNGIRDYFASRSEFSPEEEQRYRLLPRATDVPEYLDWWSFGFVVYSFALLDTVYFVGGWSYWYIKSPSWGACLGLLLGSPIILGLHLFLYRALARMREHRHASRRTSTTQPPRD
jgi:hypothetical protein